MLVMAGKIFIATVLFTSICVCSGTGSTEVVPDGLVYTELEKTLVQGVQGILTCRFYKEPYAVFWEKGPNPDDAFRMLLWHEGEVSGPRYDDGSCNIDRKSYSLIIKNVSKADTGRIYCRVSNYQGILIRNHTDVSVVDTAMETKSHLTLQMRPKLQGVLQCTVHIRPRTVAWIKKGITYSSDETLVTLENNGTGVGRSRAGYEGGIYDITKDYSLVINNVQVQNEGLYVCEVTDFDTGIAFHADTLVNVAAQPLEPFPTILECRHDPSDPSYCTLFVKSQTYLTCLVNEYYPDINLHFLYGSNNVNILETREWNNTDGTRNKTITIATIGSKELYFCVASNIPGTPDDKSASILLLDEEPFQSAILVTILSLLAVFTLLSSVACFVWRKRQPKQEQIVRNREELKKDVNDVLKQHCRAIYDLIECEYSLQHIQAEEMIDFSNILDTEQVVYDWQQSRNSGQNHQHAPKTGDTTDYAWPSDNELKSISRHLIQDSMEKICRKLKINFETRDVNDEGKVFDCLRKWRNNVAKTSIKNKHEQLSSVLESNNVRGLLPPLKGRFIYKAEIVDMAFHLLIHDFLPVAEKWGIHATKLVSYRPPFQPLHLEIGTIDLLSKLLKTIVSDMIYIFEKGDRRSFFFNIIGRLQYRNVAIHGMIAYDMSYGELFSILELMMKNTGETNLEKEVQGGTSQRVEVDAQSEIDTREKASPSSVTSISTHMTDDIFEEKDIEKGEKGNLMEPPRNHRSELELPKELSKLRDVLQLKDQDIADGRSSSDPITAYVLFKIWKEKPRPSVFNYRAALAHELRGIKMSSLADEVIAGKYINEQTSLEFVQSMVLKLDQGQLGNIGQLLKLIGEDREWNEPKDVISKQIYDWVADWTKEMKSSRYFHDISKVIKKVRDGISEVTSLETVPKRHKDLNDKLVEHGFLDLAREIMIIEQQLANVEPNALQRGIANLNPKDLIHLSTYSKLLNLALEGKS